MLKNKNQEEMELTVEETIFLMKSCKPSSGDYLALKFGGGSVSLDGNKSPWAAEILNILREKSDD